MLAGLWEADGVESIMGIQQAAADIVAVSARLADKYPRSSCLSGLRLSRSVWDFEEAGERVTLAPAVLAGRLIE